jgi:hypothetical protein
MAITKNESNLPHWVVTGIRTAVEEEVDKQITEAKERLDRKRAELIASMSLRVMEHVSLQTLGTDLVITVRKETIK